MSVVISVVASPSGATSTVTLPDPVVVGSTPPTVGPPLAENTAMLQAAFDAAGPGVPVVLQPNMIYRHGGVLHLRRAAMVVDGNGSTLQATNDTTSAVKVEASNVALSNAKLAAPSLTGKRYSQPDTHKLGVWADGFTGTDIAVIGSAASGIFLSGATNYRLDRCSVRQSRADGIHQTGGCRDGVLLSPYVENPGDDGIAVVSYGSNSAPCRRITVQSPTVNGQSFGRGMSVCGGENITYRDVRISRSYGAGLYIACESSYSTYGVSDVLVDGGVLDGCNYSTSVVHGAAILYNSRPDYRVTRVTLRGLGIANTPASAGKCISLHASAGLIDQVALADVAIQGSLAAVWSDIPCPNWTATGFTRNGQPITIA